MANPHCLRWQELLKHPGNDNPAFSDLVVDRSVLTTHLLGCVDCQILFMKISPPSDLIPNERMTYDEFSHAIRELWKLTRPKKKGI